MRLLDVLGLVLSSSSSMTNWPAWTAWPRYFRSRAPQGSPPTDYEILTQHELLAQFSDAQGRSGITPRALRNFVGSTVTTTPGGSPPTIPLPLPGWTTAERPVGMMGPAIGYNYDLRQIDMWDDRLGQWVNPAFQGGTVPGNVVFTGEVRMPHLAPDCFGRERGTLWNNGLVVSICPGERDGHRDRDKRR